MAEISASHWQTPTLPAHQERHLLYASASALNASAALFQATFAISNSEVTDESSRWSASGFAASWYRSGCSSWIASSFVSLRGLEWRLPILRGLLSCAALRCGCLLTFGVAPYVAADFADAALAV